MPNVPQGQVPLPPAQSFVVAQQGFVVIGVQTIYGAIGIPMPATVAWQFAAEVRKVCREVADHAELRQGPGGAVLLDHSPALPTDDEDIDG